MGLSSCSETAATVARHTLLTDTTTTLQSSVERLKPQQVPCLTPLARSLRRVAART